MYVYIHKNGIFKQNQCKSSAACGIICIKKKVIFFEKGARHMKFTFAEKKMEASENLRDYTIRKVSKLDKFFKKEGDASITFSIERGRYQAEITIRSGGMYYRASETTNDMYASVDSGVAAIERQIRKNKTRLEKRLRDGSLNFEAAPAVPEDDEAEQFDVIRTKRFSIKPMSTEEAILQMNLLGHEFFAFKNTDEDEAFSVVYKRKNGGYGLISDDGGDDEE